MAIRKWHAGKLIILWTWGGLLGALMLTDFMGQPSGIGSARRLIDFLGVFVILVASSAVTWYWLGGKES